MDNTQIITIEPGKRSGQPCIRGLRITVRDVLEHLAGGMTMSELLDEFPELTADDVRACLAFAAAALPGSAARASCWSAASRSATPPSVHAATQDRMTSTSN